MKEIEFRPYSNDDRNGCLEVFHSNVPKYFREHELPLFEESLEKNEYPYFVILLKGSRVGCGGFALCEKTGRADLCWGMVHQDFHKRRLGELLLVGRLNAISKMANASSVRMATSQWTETFYAKYGFETVSVKKDGFAPGLDEVEMLLTLTEQNRKTFEALSQKHFD